MTKQFLPKSRWLVTIILLTTLCINQMWGAGAISVTSSAITLPKGSTSVGTGDWISAAGVTRSGSSWAYSDWAGDQTIGSYGSITFSNAGDMNTADLLQFKKSGGNISTTISSPAGVDIEIGYKVANNYFTVSLTGAASNVTGSETSWNTMSISTTNTSATLTITKTSNGAGFVSYITITPKSGASCSVNPTIGNASLNGSFNLSTVGVQCASITPGTNCSVASGDYGFIWYQGSSSDKKIGDTGVTKVAITSGTYSSGSFSTNLSSTFSVDQTYTFRAFATNGKPATVYSSEVSFTPRSITFNSNGGSSVSTIYLNSGSTATEPTAPTKAGSVFAGWYSNEGLTTAVDWSSTISTSKTYYAKWYTVTVNVKDEAGNSLSGTGKPTASCSGTTLSTSAGSEKYVFKEWEVSNTAALGSSKTTASNSLTSITGNVTVTAIYHAPITLTKGTNTGASTFNFSSNPIGYGETLTITCAADASHKGNPTVTASGTHGTISVVSATSVTIANVQSAMTVNISYTAKEAAVVKLHVAGTTSTISGTRYEGDSYTLPDEATECPDQGLYGWYKGMYSDDKTAPSGANFYLPGASATLTAGDNVFYAVYATIGATADTYTKITTTGELTSGDYLIAGISSWCMSNTVNASNYMNEVAMSSYYNSTTGVITNTSNSDLIWTITKSGDNYTLYNAAAKKYLALTTTSPALSDAAHNFTVSLNGSCWCFSSTTTTGYMLVYSTYFKSLTAKSSDVLLYKRDQSISGPYTTSPSCVTHDLTVAVNPVAGGTAIAGKTVLGEDKTTTATATPDDHYTFSYWTISGTGSSMSNTSDGKSTDNPVTVTMGTEDATLTAHFTEKEKCTVVFKNNGVTETSTTYWLGENPVAPTLTDGDDACDATSDTHYGWTRKTWSSTIAAKSTIDAKTGNETVYNKAISLPAITAGDDGKTITYHAVWVEATGEASNEYQLVTSTSQLNVGDKIVMAHNPSGSVYLLGKDTTTYYNDAFNYQYRKYTQTTYTVTDSKITISSVAATNSERNKPFVLTLGKSGDYWTFYDDVNGGYLYAAANSDSESDHYNKNLMAWQTILTDAGKWTISITSNLATITSQTSETDKKILQRNGTSNTGIFNCYNNTQVAPCIFRNLSTISYQNFLTTCCDDNITIGTPSKTGSGTVTFALDGDAISAGDIIETCSEARDIVATVTPSSGYSCTALIFSGGSVSVDPTPGSGNYPAYPSTYDYTLSFGKNTTSATLATSVTFTAKALTGWCWKYKKDADAADGSVEPYDIPDVVEIYKDQYARFIITGYTPSDVISAKQGFVYTVGGVEPSFNTDYLTYVSKSSTEPYSYYQLKGKAPTESTTITFKAVGDNTITKTMTIRVKALPTVTFVDLIHNKSDFTNSNDDGSWTAGTGVLSSTVTTGVVSHSKKTPKHTDVAEPGTGNSCEKTHLHLIGWIRSDYSKVADYLSGTGSAPTVSELTNAGSDYWFLPDASINTETYNGKTFYAVWGVEE